MDIPETGAVFTLGKSYLSENHQSYFFIKNDPIKKVIAGDSQSAVICESGRLFVWGENQFAQISAGSKEVISKPSCVKEIKNLGYKVRNIAFGEAFSVILTENNKVFFNGKAIFTLNESYGGNFRNSDNNAHCIIHYNYEIIDFHKRCLDDHGNLDDLVDIAAGRTHFVVLTNSGKLFCYGYFDTTKTKRPKQYIEPKCISEHLVTRIAKCGRTFVVFVTDCNGIYLLGKFNGVEFSRITKLNTAELRDTTVYSIYVSQKDEIFLISSSGDVYKSTTDADIRFERIILFNQNDNIRKFCSGYDFVCVLTDKNKFLTTFNEKASAAKNPALGIRQPPHELRKFQDLRILDIAAGLYHILLFAVSKSSPSNSFDITSSDPNENIPIHKWPESDTSTKSSVDLKRSIEAKPQLLPDFKNIISSKPVLAKETLQAIQSIQPAESSSLHPIKEVIVTKVHTQPVNQLQNLHSENKKPAKSIKLIVNESTVEIPPQSQSPPPSHEESVQTEIESTSENQHTLKEQTKTMDMVTKNVSSIGDSLMTDIKSMATSGEEMLNDLAKETEKTIKEVPKNVIDYVKSSISPENGADDDDNVMKMDKEKESAAKEMPKDLTDPSSPPMEQINDSPNDPIESEQVKQNNKLNRALAEDDSNETIADEIVNNEVKFINNGVDVSHSPDIIQAMNDEIHEMSTDAKNKADELTMKFDGAVNDGLSAAKDAASAKLFEIKNVGNDVMKQATAASADLMTKIIPLKYDLEEVDLEADVDTEQTTASIKSVSTPAKNQIAMEETNVDTMEMAKDMDANAPQESEGRVKRFFKEIKNNCKTADTVVEMEESAVDQMKAHSIDDLTGDNKTSKVCTIL